MPLTAEDIAASKKNGEEAVAETRAIMERKGLKLNKGLKKLKDLMEATKPISCNLQMKAGKDKDQKDADSLTTDFIEVPDNTTQVKALDMFFRLRGDYPAEKKDVKHEGTVTIEVINYADKVDNPVDK